GTAGVFLFARRLVLRRGATDRVGDHAVGQRQVVLAVRLIGPVREAGLLQGVEQQPARVVAGEGAACAVGPHAARRQARNQQAGVGIAEGGGGAVPPVRVLAGVFLTIGDQARAQGAVARRFRVQSAAHARSLRSRVRATPWFMAVLGLLKWVMTSDRSMKASA